MAVVIHHRKLRAEKAYLGLDYRTLAKEARKSTQTLADVLAGRPHVSVRTLAEVAAVLGMGVVIDFVLLEEEPVDLAAKLRRRWKESGCTLTN